MNTTVGFISPTKPYLDFRTLTLLVGLLTFCALKNVAEANVAAKLAVPTSRVISHFENEEKTRSLTADEKDTLELAFIARDALQIKVIFLRKAESEELSIQRMGPFVIANAIAAKIRKMPKWMPTLSKDVLQEVEKHQDALQRRLEVISYSWAWIEFQRGKRESAQEILSGLFDRHYDAVMALKEVISTSGEPESLASAEQELKVLKSISSNKNEAAREAKLKEMKDHLKKTPIRKGHASQWKSSQERPSENS